MHWSSATYNLCIWVTARYMKVENNKKQTPNWMRIYMIFRETESVVVVAHRPQPIRHRFVCVFLHFLVSRAHRAPNWIVLVPCIRAAVAATCICLRKSCCLCRSALLSLRKKWRLSCAFCVMTGEIHFTQQHFVRHSKEKYCYCSLPTSVRGQFGGISWVTNWVGVTWRQIWVSCLRLIHSGLSHTVPFTAYLGHIHFHSHAHRVIY